MWIFAVHVAKPRMKDVWCIEINFERILHIGGKHAVNWYGMIFIRLFSTCSMKCSLPILCFLQANPWRQLTALQFQITSRFRFRFKISNRWSWFSPRGLGILNIAAQPLSIPEWCWTSVADLSRLTEPLKEKLFRYVKSTDLRPSLSRVYVCEVYALVKAIHRSLVNL